MQQRRRMTLAQVLGALVAALALAGASGCGSSGSGSEATGDPATDKLAQVLARGTLVGFFEPDYPPQSLRVENAQRPADTKCAANQLTTAEVTGYDTVTMRLVAEKLGVEACFATPTWTEVIAGNWGDRLDIAYASGSINADRMQRLYMTQPYYAVPNFYFVAADSPAKDAADLEGKRIGACAGCSHEAYLRGELSIPGVEIDRGLEQPTIVTYQTEGPGLLATARGRIDAYLASDPVGQARIDEGQALRRLPDLTFTEYQTGFVDRSSGFEAKAFVTRINEIIKGLHADGTLKKLSVEWFGKNYATAGADYDIAAIGQTVE